MVSGDTSVSGKVSVDDLGNPFDLPAIEWLSAGMKKKSAVQYTVRDVPEEIDSLLRESATLEGVSLNQATLHALERGLGKGPAPVRYRSLRQLVSQKQRPAMSAWRKTLKELDKPNPEDWK